MRTLGLCIIELLVFSTNALAQKFREHQTHQNLTHWCNMHELLTDRTTGK